MRDYISHAQIALYLQCPLRFSFRYIDGIKPVDVPSAVAYGRTIHRAIASFYETAKEGKPFRLEAWLKIFKEDWKEAQENEEIRYRKGEDFESLLKEGEELLCFYARSANPQKVIAVEEEFSCDLSDRRGGEVFPLPIKGVVDLVEEDEEGRIFIVEHKTSKRRFADWEIEGSLQLSMYAYAAKEMGWLDSDRILCRMDVLLKTKKPDLVHYYVLKDRDDFAKLYRIVEGIGEAMQERIIYPRYGYWCLDCPYVEQCREW